MRTGLSYIRLHENDNNLDNLCIPLYEPNQIIFEKNGECQFQIFLFQLMNKWIQLHCV